MAEAVLIDDGLGDAEEASALARAFDRVMHLIDIDPVLEPEVAKRIGRTLIKVFKANAAEMPIDDLAYATMIQVQADSAPIVIR